MSFSDHSRYKTAGLRNVAGPDGDTVTIVEAPVRVVEPTVGWHLKKPGQRLDRIAHAFLGHATEWWRLSDHNNAMWPDAIVEAPEMAVPPKKRSE